MRHHDTKQPQNLLHSETLISMLPSLLERHVVHSMAMFFAALVCTCVIQSSFLQVLAPPVPPNSWMVLSPSQSSSHNNNHTSHDNETATTTTALALAYPPGLVGGYRNQVIRLAGLIQHAQSQNISQLLLPTILFGTTYRNNNPQFFFPIPIDQLFDISHWNENFHNTLPTLVTTLSEPDCWDPQPPPRTVTNTTFESHHPDVQPLVVQLLQDGTAHFVTPLLPLTRQLVLQGNTKNSSTSINPRKMDVLPLTQHCQRPVVYGSGQGAGRLWNDMMRNLKEEGPQDKENNHHNHNDGATLLSLLAQALLPLPRWRRVAEQCIRQHQAEKDDDVFSSYIALHARVETDMLMHRCSREMERNLTRIFDMVEDFHRNYTTKTSAAADTREHLLDGVFVAVSRHGMRHTTRQGWVRDLMRDNWETLTNLHKKKERRLSFFECGEFMMDEWYRENSDRIPMDYYGSILPSMLNFYIATRAEIFIGVAKSSWSTDVWTARYHQGKGSQNFEYTRHGIVPVPNSGLPEPHGNC